MKVTILGCGSSTGIPMISCKCPVCTSENPKNKRSRVSLFIEIKGKNLLIDSSPDLRHQALREGVSRVDAVLYTHDHADHTHGIDDLRSFNYLSGDAIPIYCDQPTYDSLHTRFGYIFQKNKPEVWYRPMLTANVLPTAPIHRFEVFGIPITCFEQNHGKVKTLGYRIGDFAYSTDTDGLPETAFEALAGVKTWVVDCLSYKKSMTHATLETTLGWVSQVKPELAILTHMAHDMDYDTLLAELPKGVVPGYDGMVINI